MRRLKGVLEAMVVALLSATSIAHAEPVFVRGAEGEGQGWVFRINDACWVAKIPRESIAATIDVTRRARNVTEARREIRIEEELASRAHGGGSCIVEGRTQTGEGGKWSAD
jgi:hypothetical protein